jgi:hypothetical protein
MWQTTTSMSSSTIAAPESVSVLCCPSRSSKMLLHDCGDLSVVKGQMLVCIAESDLGSRAIQTESVRSCNIRCVQLTVRVRLSPSKFQDT